MNQKHGLFIAAFLYIFTHGISDASASDYSVDDVIRDHGIIETSILFEDKNGKEIFSLHPDHALPPASTMKLLTGLAYLNRYEKTGWRPSADFMISGNDLYIRGKFTMLITEDFAEIAKRLKTKGIDHIERIYFDHSYFPVINKHGNHDLNIPGINPDDPNPYNAKATSLIINFNSIYFSIHGSSVTHGNPKRGEPVTPFPRGMEATVLSKVNKSDFIGRRQNARVNPGVGNYYEFLTRQIAALFESHGIRVDTWDRQKEKPFPTASIASFIVPERWSPIEKVRAILKYSNNLMANQIFFLSVADDDRLPDIVEVRKKMLKVANDMGLQNTYFVDGAGISGAKNGKNKLKRQTLLSARDLSKILSQYRDRQSLLSEFRDNPKLHGKTGSLDKLSTFAGYDNHGNRVVIMLKGGKNLNNARKKIAHILVPFGR